MFTTRRRVEHHVIELRRFKSTAQIFQPCRFHETFGLAGAMGERLCQGMKRTRGFTLVEVMILLLIIALLLAMVIPALQKIKQAKEKPATEPPAAGAPAKP
jgi:prepilin-type N-terminal cleavage/methylation domain-containing protein